MLETSKLWSWIFFTFLSCRIITHILTAFLITFLTRLNKKNGHPLLGLSSKVFTFDHLFTSNVQTCSIVWQFLWLNGQKTVKIDAWALAQTVQAFIFVKEYRKYVHDMFVSWNVDLCLLTVGQCLPFPHLKSFQNIFNSRFRLNSIFFRKPYGMEFSSRRNVVPGNNVCWSLHLNKRAQLREERNGKRVAENLNQIEAVYFKVDKREENWAAKILKKAALKWHWRSLVCCFCIHVIFRCHYCK